MKTFNESFSPNKGFGIRVSLGNKKQFPGQASPGKVKGQHIDFNSKMANETMLIDSPDNVGEYYGKASSPIQGFG